MTPMTLSARDPQRGAAVVWLCVALLLLVGFPFPILMNALSSYVMKFLFLFFSNSPPFFFKTQICEGVHKKIVHFVKVFFPLPLSNHT